MLESLLGFCEETEAQRRLMNSCQILAIKRQPFKASANGSKDKEQIKKHLFKINL
jgi:hypothetical protein